MPQEWRSYKPTDFFLLLFLAPSRSCFISFQAGKKWNRRVNILNTIGRISASALQLRVARGCCSVVCRDRERYVQQEKAQLMDAVKYCPRVLPFNRPRVAFDVVRSFEVDQHWGQLELTCWLGTKAAQGAHTASLLLLKLLSAIISRTWVMKNSLG